MLAHRGGPRLARPAELARDLLPWACVLGAVLAWAVVGFIAR